MSCPPEAWGVNLPGGARDCSRTCDCLPGETCGVQDGLCINPCRAAGWWGQLCNKQCGSCAGECDRYTACEPDGCKDGHGGHLHCRISKFQERITVAIHSQTRSKKAFPKRSKNCSLKKIPKKRSQNIPKNAPQNVPKEAFPKKRSKRLFPKRLKKCYSKLFHKLLAKTFLDHYIVT